MTRLNMNSRGAERQRGCQFAEAFDTQAHVEANGGVVTSAPSFSVDNGATFDGTDDKITYGDIVYGVKSISFWVSLSTTTEDLIKLSASHSVTVSGGTVSATGFTSPTIEIDGTATTTIAANGFHFVTCRTATAFDVDALVIGEVTGFGAFSIRDIKLWDSELSLAENADYYNETTWTWRERALVELPMLNANVSGNSTTNVGTLGSAGDAIAGASYPDKQSWQRGYLFNPDNDRFVISDQEAIRFDAADADFTLACMFSFVPEPSFQYFFSKTDASNDGYVLHDIGNGQIRLSIDATDVTTTTAVTDGPITTLVASVDRSANADMYINGRLDKSGDVSAAGAMSTTADLVIGNRNALARGMSGVMYTAFIFPFALTPLQANDLHRTMMREINRE